jgi:hypothetical protein
MGELPNSMVSEFTDCLSCTNTWGPTAGSLGGDVVTVVRIARPDTSASTAPGMSVSTTPDGKN